MKGERERERERKLTDELLGAEGRDAEALQTEKGQPLPLRGHDRYRQHRRGQRGRVR